MNYCERLELVCELFLRSEDSPKDKEYTQMFSCIEEIIVINTSICSSLSNETSSTVIQEVKVGFILR
jgi:hypothetical protein